MPPSSPQPDWRAAPGHRPRQGKQFDWKQTTPAQPGLSKRRARRWIWGTASVLVLVAIIWVVLWLLPPTPADFVLVAARPTGESALRLDVPLDPFGWLGVKHIDAWLRSSTKGKVEARDEITSLSDLETCLESSTSSLRRFRRQGPLIVYLGLHGGVDAEGKPVLYTGKPLPNSGTGADAIRIEAILKAMEGISRPVLLVLDPARRAPDLPTGHFSHDFVRALKADSEVRKWLDSKPNIVIFCGSGEGQRGWDSEELGQPVFSHYFFRALSDEADKTGEQATVRLINDVILKTSNWATQCRDASQVPFAYPENWQARLDKVTYFPPEHEKIASTPGTSSSESLKGRWTEHDELAQSQPHPAAYTPMAWRRYRELLLRYEHLSRAQASGGEFQGVLADLDRELNGLRDAIKKQRSLDLDPVIRFSAPLARATGSSVVPAELASLRSLDGQEPQALIGALKGTPARNRSVETHFAFMLVDYLNDWRKAPTANEPWREAVRIRQLAEHAALGIPTDARAPLHHAYSDRLWPFIRQAILDGDRQRRQTEDSLFVEAVDKTATPSAPGQLDVRRRYETILQQASILASALAIRDQVLADLPYLAAWLAEERERKSDFDAALALFPAAHDLTNTLEQYEPGAVGPPQTDASYWEKLQTDSRKLRKHHEDLKLRFIEACRGDHTSREPREWRELNRLLAAPLNPENRREYLLNQSRETSRALQEKFDKTVGPEKNAQASSGPPAPAVDAVVGNRVRVAAGILQDRAWQQARDLPFRSASALDDEAKGGGSDPEVGRKIGQGIAHHFAKLVTFPETEYASKRRLAERMSHVAVPFGRMTEDEPAVVARKWRWRVLLEGLACRAAEDHWYDEDGNPYFAHVTTGYLAAAKALFPASPALGEDGTRASGLLSEERLSLRCSVPESRLSWTSEQRNQVHFSLSRHPKVVGIAAYWSDLTPGPLSMDPESPTRRPVPLGPEKPLELPPVRLAIPREAVVTDLKKLTAHVYFRGQRPGKESELTISINRKPDLVIEDHKPRDSARIAFRADDSGYGAIAIVLDYSGSMTAEIRGKTKKDLMLDELQKVLADIPEETPISIFAFSHRTMAASGDGGDTSKPIVEKQDAGVQTDKAEVERIFPRKDVAMPSAKLSSGERTGVLKTLRGLYPVDLTPLVRAIDVAARTGFSATDEGRKSIVVLTDGMDTSEGYIRRFRTEEAARQKQKEIIDAVRAKVTRLSETFNSKIELHMIFIADPKAGESSQERMEYLAAEEQFSPIKGFKPPGTIQAAGSAELAEILSNSLRPQIRIRTIGNQPVEGIAEAGVPSNRLGDAAGTILYTRIPDNQGEEFNLALAGVTQRIRLKRGDHPVVRVTGGARGIEFRRELYYGRKSGSPDRNPMVELDRDLIEDDKDWQLGMAYRVLKYTHAEARSLVMVVAAEKLPGKESPIEQLSPGLAWFKLLDPSNEPDGKPPGTIWVRREDRYPAHSWTVIGENWKPAGSSRERGLLKAWISTDYSSKLSLTVKPQDLPKPDDYLDREVSQGLKVRVSRETNSFRKFPDLDALPEKKEYLVVRVTYPEGQRVFAQPRNGLDPGEQQHWYFDKANAYTAIFGPIASDSWARGPEIRFDFVAISELERDKPILLNPSTWRGAQPLEIK